MIQCRERTARLARPIEAEESIEDVVLCALHLHRDGIDVMLGFLERAAALERAGITVPSDLLADLENTLLRVVGFAEASLNLLGLGGAA